MADKKALKDSEIEKVSGGFYIPFSNSQRNLGEQVNIDSNNPKCPYCQTPLTFQFKVTHDDNQTLFACEKCCIGFVKYYHFPAEYYTWHVDAGKDS